MKLKDLEAERQRMVDEQIVRRGLTEARLLAAMRAVPRHEFVPAEYIDYAYDDSPLPIGNGQTISQPYIVALMTHLLELRGTERVLEVGTGSGYQTAVLAHMAAEVYSVEILPELAGQARVSLNRLGLSNVHCHLADGSLGWPNAAPYDGILVTASAPDVPPPLLEQLADGGRLVLPVGGRLSQELLVVTRQGGKYERRTVLSVAFVPLRGVHGWKTGDF
jgi:protein-L-isoaspartate(D-aspartate) O-methyltransferase